jgi:syntaxin 7
VLQGQEYKATQKVAAEREAQSLPRAPPPPKQSAGSSASAAAGGDVEAGLEATALLQQQQQVEARHMDNAIAYNEALIEERDHNISEITRQIGEVNEMFQVGSAPAC